ncbi:MAG: hypothetical protein A2X51_12290 [Candidatus Rokubacteria bacterium GWC2_70_24]|nr:hypothetical protein [Candidatus Rokubacteria bacterium]OGK93849.1 MAG: hypothetical protein A2X51_12290 [Candidatus Rokubacteria bacterium GWC2_70_24]
MRRAHRLARLAAAPVALALLLLAAGCGRPPNVPPSLAGLPLTHTTQGAEALAEIGRLHGKRILLRDAWVAHYERNAAVAMLYVSRSYLGPVARWQFSRMVDGIGRGAANAEGRFTHLRHRDEAGIPLYSALGLGQVHYFYRSGPAIVWLAADAEIARAAVADTIRRVR